MKGKELLCRLAALGAETEKARGKGGHQLVRYKGRKAPVSTHGNIDLGPEYIKMLCRQLGIDPKEL